MAHRMGVRMAGSSASSRPIIGKVGVLALGLTAALWQSAWAQGAPGTPDITPEPPAVAKECGETSVGATPLPNSALALEKRKQVKILAIGASSAAVLGLGRDGNPPLLEQILERNIKGLDVEIINRSNDLSTESPVETPLWESLQRVASQLHPGARNVPYMTVGATDARFFRRLGVTAYGFGLFSNRITFDEFSSMFHGDNEKVDQESLRLSTELWQAVASDLLG